MAEQLWKGRFSKAVDSRVNDFNSSIRFDQRMIAQDMRGSGVHATMLAKQGIISEQECNFVGILAATRSGDPAYRYAGWLEGYVHLSNSLYSIDPERCLAIRDTLPETVRADLWADSAYWARFRGPVSQASEAVYDVFLKTNGDANGVRSYGMVTDLLVTYFDA